MVTFRAREITKLLKSKYSDLGKVSTQSLVYFQKIDSFSILFCLFPKFFVFLHHLCVTIKFKSMDNIKKSSEQLRLVKLLFISVFLLQQSYCLNKCLLSLQRRSVLCCN